MSSQSLYAENNSSNGLYINNLHKSLEIVVCLRCGRPLTNEKSRLACLGPTCARKLAYEVRSHSYSFKTLTSQQHSRAQYGFSCPPSLPTQQITLFYNQHSSQKPYCKLGRVSLSATDTKTEDGHGHQKRAYQLPLLEGIIYQIFEPLPQPRVLYLHVQDQQLQEKTYTMD